MTAWPTPATSSAPAKWIVDGIRGFGESVLSLVPAGFEAYGRLAHPAGRPGNLPKELRAPIVDALRAQTSTPDSCWFAVWEGFGARPFAGDATSFELPHRKYDLYHGPVEALLAPSEPPWTDQAANIWWPDDRAWCVATEVDLESTYVGGSAACITALASHRRARRRSGRRARDSLKPTGVPRRG